MEDTNLETDTASENISCSERRAVCCPAGTAKAICKDNTGKRRKLVALYLLYEADWAKVVVRANLLFASDIYKYEPLAVTGAMSSSQFLPKCLYNEGHKHHFTNFSLEKAQDLAGGCSAVQKQCNRHLSVCLLCASRGKTK